MTDPTADRIQSEQAEVLKKESEKYKVCVYCGTRQILDQHDCGNNPSPLRIVRAMMLNYRNHFDLERQEEILKVLTHHIDQEPADRLGKLDELYDVACDTLLRMISPALKITKGETNAYGEEIVEEITPMPLLVERSEVALGIIDRWLAVRESDRRYELRRYESGMDYKDDGYPFGEKSGTAGTETHK